MDEQDWPSLRPVADGVFAWVQPNDGGWVENAGVIITPDGVILIDTGDTEQHARELLWAVAHATSGAPVICAVNTRQDDHSFGDDLLPKHTVITGRETSQARRPPALTIGTSLSLHHGDHEVEVIHPGYPAHSADDLVAWLPRQGVLFTGCLLSNQGTPVAYRGSIEGSLRALDWLAGFAPDHVVPGHGPLIDASGLSAVLDAQRRYYQLVLDTARAGVRDGLSPLEAARRCELGPFADLPEAQRIVLNLHRAYADIDAAAFDLARAIADSVAYNSSLINVIG